MGKSRGAGGYAWLTDHFAFVPLRIVHVLIAGIEVACMSIAYISIPALNLVLQRQSGARLVHLAVKVKVEGRSRHLSRFRVMFLTTLAVAALSGIEVPPNGHL